MTLGVERLAPVYERIASGIAGKGFAVIDKFFTEEETRILRDTARSSFAGGSFRRAGLGRQQDYQRKQSVRGDFIQWVNRENLPAEAAFLMDYLDGLTAYLNRELLLGIRDREIHFAIYPEGAFYRRHLDVFRGSTARKLSVICYLNEHWQGEDGGQLRLYLSDDDGVEKPHEILPIGGRLVVFRSDLLEHEVLSARRERFSLTGWLKDERSFF